MSISAEILAARRRELVTELQYQEGQEERLTAAIADLPGIISALQADIAELRHWLAEGVST